MDVRRLEPIMPYITPCCNNMIRVIIDDDSHPAILGLCDKCDSVWLGPVRRELVHLCYVMIHPLQNEVPDDEAYIYRMYISPDNYFVQEKINDQYKEIFIPGMEVDVSLLNESYFPRDCDLISNIKVHTIPEDGAKHHILTGGNRILETETDKFTQTDSVCLPIYNLQWHTWCSTERIKSYIKYMIPNRYREYLTTQIPFGDNTIIIMNGMCGTAIPEPIPCDYSTLLVKGAQ